MSRSVSDHGTPGCSRREFMGAVTASLLASTACRRRPYDRSKFSVPDRSRVALFAAPSYAADFADLIGRGLSELGVDVRGRRVLLKPNLVEFERGSAINTNPVIIAGAAVALKRAGASEVVVGEGPGHRRDIEYLLTQTGLLNHLRDERLRFVDLNADDVSYVPLASRFTGLAQLAFPAAVLNADLVVSLPKLKTHHWAGMTASMKNFFGVIPGAVYGWPKNILHIHGIEQAIVDINATIRPHLSIVDGVTAMEGDGPIMGDPRHLGLVAMGTDLVAVDATCARVIGLDPAKLGYLRLASEFLGNLAEDRIEQRGERPSRFATSFAVDYHLTSLRLAAG